MLLSYGHLILILELIFTYSPIHPYVSLCLSKSQHSESEKLGFDVHENSYPENKEAFCERGIKNNKLFKLPSFLSSQGYFRIWFSFLLEMNSQNINVSICVLWLHTTGTNSG